ncbi:pyridoxamine 5'-phosphate oxidase family protein [Natronincola ferrireducens]|uniref:Nitroimidazol reductase NimA, pyridoxamine 5'-phosphate oxidase superfamily n=1 Tax=Natronincola ferrireducens TaxID=393762 RepID=A0A1G8YL90_9FIRM|nr:pyridoxamine 5'-phosphate oxidase family protein [Natronincola ferrireducens]SDK03506.1 Nitroimidazol reductase NimA, pyridoxamine 5'-phosphate oxidase superfamily [Natronincola ferrireducens]
MRREEREVKDKALIESILQKALFLRIALCDGDKPYIVPMNFGYREGILYLHSSRKGKKIELLKSNNNVAFQMDIDTAIVKADSPCDWSMKYASLTGYGRAEFIEDYDEKIEGLTIIMKKYGEKQCFNFSEMSVKNVTVIKITIEEMTGKKTL